MVDTNYVREPNVRGPTSLINRFTSTYLRARWFIGAGLIVLTAFALLVGAGGEYVWVVAVAGVVILAHTFAMRVWDLHAASVALVVDLTAALVATMIVASANHDLVPVLLTLVGASVLIPLFLDGWTRVAVAAYVTTLSLGSMLMINDWDFGLAVSGFIGGFFLAALIMGVIVAIRSRIVELEAARAQTIGVVSHELRNHLTGIIAAVELVTDEGIDLTPTEVGEMLEMALQQSVEAAEVIEDLLVASRAERGVLDAIAEVVDVSSLTETVIRRTSTEEGRIRFQGPAGPVWATADPLRYKQVLRNLLTNALRYGGDEVRVSVEARGQWVSVIVADNGPGVDPADESVLFQAYHRGRHQGPAEGSSGLGLWIARGLAHKMGGELAYRRASGHTVFEITLPNADTSHHSDSSYTMKVGAASVSG